MSDRFLPLLGAMLLCVVHTGAEAAGSVQDPGESVYLGEMPVVLSVSRLAQPLDEAPGAVTIIDRDMIRRSGARELAELLRLVPGFIVSHFDGGARPFATYHADYDSYNRRLQVYIDGRSVYSGLVLGSAAYGMMGVVLEDIERIEVLRGSNSAAYGANAFLGVINIVTRHAADVQGGLVSAQVGGQEVRDVTARIGWGTERQAFRLTAATRRDSGFDAIFDDKQVDQLHFRGDLGVSPTDDLTLSAGLTHFTWGVPIEPGNTETWRNSYAHLRWQRRHEEGGGIQAGVLLDEEEYNNFYPLVQADGRTRRFGLDAQHTFMPTENWRVVWGGEYRYEGIQSAYLFNARLDQANQLWRLFGNAEWRPHPGWVINAGGLWEHHSLSGEHASPRLVVNHHLLPGHTIRVGATTAYKLPSQLEMRADWKLNGVVPVMVSSGNVRPERIDSREIGYLGQFGAWNMSLDVRLFEEEIESLVRLSNGFPKNPVNRDPSRQHGWEAQLRWKPLAGTEWLVNHTSLHLDPLPASDSATDKYRAPSHVSMVALFQKLPADFDLSLTYSRTGAMFWVSPSTMVPAYAQLDMRLAKSFLIDATRAEVAIVMQAASGGHVEYSLGGGLPSYYQGRRVFATLRLAF